jgi:hypothetical protein
MSIRRQQILETAARYVGADRNTQYGEPEDNFNLIAQHWNTYLRRKLLENLDAYDVACMMVAFKLARLQSRPKDPDSAIDAAGYAACAGEILERLHAREARAADAANIAHPSPCYGDAAFEEAADTEGIGDRE